MLLTSVVLIVLCHWINTVSAGPIYARNKGTVFYQEVPVAQPPTAYRAYRSAYQPVNPQRTMVFHGYYSRPMIRPRQAIVPIPEGAMTAFAAGETVAAGSSYLQPTPQITDCPQQSTNCNGYPDAPPDVAPIIVNKHEPQTAELPAPSDIILPEVSEGQELENQIPDTEGTTATPILHEEPEITTKIPQRKNKASKIPPRIPETKRPEDDATETEDDDDEPEYNPFAVGRGNFPVYNSFFPMVFGGSGGGFGVVPSARKRGNSEEPTNFPRGATAIANSFSTGKGGVATSHATAYGSPQP